MYRSVEDAKNLTWHADERIRDGMIRHPADSPQWMKIDHEYPDFGQEARNLRLALSTDGINPHGIQSSSHSTWPVIMLIYNLPPWLCMKRKFMMLSMLISGSKQPGNDIDIHLAPLIEDLKLMWETGVEVYDGYRKECFNLRAMLFGTINDFPAYGELATNGWKKRSIFLELPYWKSLYVRHFLDVMHIEKNVCDSVIGTLLNVPEKSKDGINARLDLVSMGIRNELGPKKRGNRIYLPPAAHTLSRKEKIVFCEFLRGVKVLEGYSSNIKSPVSMKGLKLKNLKSHDFHVLMEHLLPIGIRSIFPENVRWAITKLCYFFRAICSKVIDPEKLPALQREIVITLCELEMYFPPSFFNIMVHLTVHLVKETQLCGPAYMRWMYPIERYIKILIGYMKNRSRPEGCIVERYTVEEAVEFCTEYLSNVESIGLPRSHHSERTSGEGIIGNKIVTISAIEWEQAHLYVLHNVDEVEKYVEMHKDKLRSLNTNKNESWITREHNRSFISWLKDYIHAELAVNPSSISDRLRWLASGPSIHIFSYSGYTINGYTFYTKEQDDQSTMQNSGVTLIAKSMHISSAKDRTPRYANMSYFGVIDRIWELDYTVFRLPVFGCKWVDNNNGIRVDESRFMLVNLNRVGYKDEPFILASQGQQVFYVTDPADKSWSVVLLTNKINDQCNQNQEDTNTEDDPFSETSQLLDIDPTIDDILYKRNDHDDGIWIDPPFSVTKTKKTRNTSRKRKRST